MLVCKWCFEEKPEEAFNRAPKNKSGRQGHCRECHSKYFKARRAAGLIPKTTYEYNRAAMLWTKYRLRPEQFAAIMVSQNNACAICEESFSGVPCVDHDHTCCPGEKTCGKCIRGFLCGSCNTGIARFMDNPVLLSKAASYLVKSSEGAIHGTAT